MPNPKKIVFEPDIPDELDWLDYGNIRLMNPRKYKPEFDTQEPNIYLDYNENGDRIGSVRDMREKQENALRVFQNDEFGEVRALTIDGEPWFVAVDVCKALDVANATDAIKRLDDDERARFNLGHPYGETNIVNEPGLYTLVLGSRKSQAKPFKRWLTHDVIPSIRKTGSYNVQKALPAPAKESVTMLREKNRMALNIIRASKDDKLARIIAQIYGIEE